MRAARIIVVALLIAAVLLILSVLVPTLADAARMDGRYAVANPVRVPARCAWVPVGAGWEVRLCGHDLILRQP
jgi:hypothetical protein